MSMAFSALSSLSQNYPPKQPNHTLQSFQQPVITRQYQGQDHHNKKSMLFVFFLISRALPFLLLLFSRIQLSTTVFSLSLSKKKLLKNNENTTFSLEIVFLFYSSKRSLPLSLIIILNPNLSMFDSVTN